MRGIDDPVEMEARPAPVVHRLLEPDARIEEQLPRRAGDDEGERQRIEIDRPQNAFAADLLVEQDGERQAEEQAEDDIEPAENAHVDQRRVPVRRRVGLERPGPQLLVVAEADEIGAGESLRVGEGQQQRPQVEAVDEDQHESKGRRQHEARQPVLQARAHASAAGRRRRRSMGEAVVDHAASPA